MLVSSKKIEKMLRDRDRLERMAKIEYQEAAERTVTWIIKEGCETEQKAIY